VKHKKVLTPEQKAERKRERLAEQFNTITDRAGEVQVKVEKNGSTFTRMVARVVKLGDAGWHVQVYKEDKKFPYSYKHMGSAWWAGVERIVSLMGGE